MARQQQHPDRVAKWESILGDNKELPPAVEEFLLAQLFSPCGRWVKLARALEVGYADLRQERTTLARQAGVSYVIACVALVIGLTAVGMGLCLWVLNATGLTSAGTVIGIGVLFKTVAAAIFHLYARIDKRQADVSRCLDDHCRLLRAFQMAFFLPSRTRDRMLERVIVAHLQTV